MRVAEIRLDLLQVPLRTSLVTATADWASVRLGILRLRTDGGLEGLAELALDDAADAAATDVDVRSDARRLTQLEAELAVGLPASVPVDGASLARWVDGLVARVARSGSLDPSLAQPMRSALASAAADVLARADGLSLAAWLVHGSTGGRAAHGLRPGTAPGFLQSPPSEVVWVNALLGIADPEAVAAQARRLVDAGFRCLKLKAGAEARGQVARRVAAVRDVVGTAIAIRLDLNGSLDEASALELLAELAAYALDYVEQPVPASAGPEALARLRRQVAVPIAADEAVTDVTALQRLVHAGAVDAVVVKPGRVGGLLEAARMVELALASQTRVTVSTLLESGIGVTTALHLAASVPGQAAHGLSTSGLLATDLLREPLAVRAGRLAVPRAPGLGVALDEASLARHEVREDGPHA
jgi:L-alanine-DL-glutamate epimerase-like enolase superfamily enzyme